MTRNEKRVKRAAKSLEFYKASQLKEAGPVDPDTVTDFLTDLRHYCERHELDVYALLDCSYNRYLAERRT